MDLREVRADAHERHPWEKARFHFFSSLIDRTKIAAGCHRLLDVGSGDAWFARSLLSHLPPDASVTCWDIGYESNPEIAKAAEGPRLSCTATRPTEKAEVILLMDVLEHVDGPNAFLKTLVDENLVPGGHVVISVPAWQALYSRHDEQLLHHRRFSARDGRALVESSGLTIVESGGLFHSLMVPRLAVKGLEALSGFFRKSPPEIQQAEWRGGKLVTALITDVLNAEGVLSQAFASAGVEVPGLTWWALARR